MAQFASDAFTNTAGTALPTHDAAWALHTSYTGSAVITDVNSARTNTSAGTGALYYHSGAPASADYTVTADLLFKDANGGNGLAGVVGRVDTAAHTYYVARYDGRTSDRWELRKVVAGVDTLLGSSAESITDETSHNIKLEMIGTAIKLYKDGSGVATVSVTDSAITAAGKSGLFVYNSASANNTSGIQVDTFSGDDVTGGSPYTMTADSGSFTLTGNATGLQAGRKMVAASATYTLTGNASTLTVARKLAAATGSFTLTGNAAGLKAARKLVAASGAFTLTGNAATLTYTPAGYTYTMSAAAGTFTLTGNATALQVARKMTAGTGGFTLTGNDVTFTHRSSAWTDVSAATGTWTDKPLSGGTWTTL